MFSNGKIENWYCLVETNGKYEGVKIDLLGKLITTL